MESVKCWWSHYRATLKSETLTSQYASVSSFPYMEGLYAFRTARDLEVYEDLRKAAMVEVIISGFGFSLIDIATCVSLLLLPYK